MESPAVLSEAERDQGPRFADMFAALGAEPRLRIVRLLLSAHPEGMVVGEIQDELRTPASTLSHHLDRLKSEGLVCVKRESTYLRYTANVDVLRELLTFLYAECCTRNQAVRPEAIVQICS
jgi:ArsR family transcriptional regulator, arsenate/arsenite/antimonite-responsive transcriptional repressor